MAIDIGKAYVQIVPSAQGIQGSISKVLNGESLSAGKSAGNNIAGNIISTLKKAIPAAAIGKLFYDSIRAGADLEQSIGGIETLFGTGGAETVATYAKMVGKSVGEVREEFDTLQRAQTDMLANADKAYMTAGLSANDYMQTVTSFAASLKQSTGGDMEALTSVANQAVIDMADNANKMGTDMQSIQNAYQGFAKQNYTMLDNLKLGYGGTKGEMERLLKDASKISGIKYDISNLDDVYNAIHVIQEDLGITGTTAKEAAGTISGSFNMLKASFSNVMANLALGQDIGPSLTNLVNAASTFLFDNLIPAVVNVASQLPGAIVTAISEAGPAIGAKGLELLQNLSTGFTQGFPEMMSQVGELIVNLAKAIWDNREQILEIGRNIIDGLVEGLKSFASKIGEALLEIVSDAWTSVKNFLGIKSPSRKFMYLGEMTAEGLAKGLYGSTNLVQNAMDSLLRPVNDPMVNPSLAFAGGSSVGSFAITFNIDNSGKDITDEDIKRWGSKITDVVNENLGRMV